MSDNKNTTSSQLNKLRAEYIRLSKELIENRIAETAALFFAKHPKVQSVEVESSEQYNDNEYYTSLVIDDADAFEINGITLYRREDGDSYTIGPALTEGEHCDAADDVVEMIFSEFDSDDFINVYGDNFDIKLTPTKVIVNC